MQPVRATTIPEHLKIIWTKGIDYWDIGEAATN